MFLRYSSRVVAPTQCSSPRARAGLSMLEASIAPSALPAPTSVCNSSMNRMMPSAPEDEQQHLLVFEALRHVAIDEALPQPLDDRGLADPRLADQHRVVLGAA